jgi:hypothetical protein
MSILSLSVSECRLLLSEYIAAERAILKNQSYTIGDKTYVRANLTSVRNGRKDLETRLAQLTQGGSMRVRRVLPRDDY